MLPSRSSQQHHHVVQNENELNSNNNIKSKSQSLTDQAVSSQISNASRTRTVLGDLPVNTLYPNQYSQTHQNHYTQQTSQQQITKSRIPILVDNQSQQNHHQQEISGTSSSPNINLDTDGDDPSMNQQQYAVENQENYHFSQQETVHQHQHQHQHTNHHDYIEDEESDEDEAYFGKSFSPVLTPAIEHEINEAYKNNHRKYLDPNDEDTHDVTMVAEYGSDIFNHLHHMEMKFRPNEKYMDDVQQDLNWKHRSILLDWLVQLHSRFNLLPETLFLSVNIIDRFLSKRTISVSRFQLCGAAALFIAAKYEEINVPTVSQMLYMLGNEFERSDFLKAEKYMVEILGFEFGWPGPMSFLRRGSKADDYDNEIRTLAKYFLEITIMDPKFVATVPSFLAAGAQYLAIKMLGRGDWTQKHIYYNGYAAEQLIPMVEYLEYCCVRAKTHHKAIYEKYSERKFKRASEYVQQYLQQFYEDISQ